jgi:hypothetical protein
VGLALGANAGKHENAEEDSIGSMRDRSKRLQSPAGMQMATICI